MNLFYFTFLLFLVEVKSQAQTSTTFTNNYPSLSSSLPVFPTNVIGKYDKTLSLEFGKENDARWLYWEFFMETIDKPVLVSGIATNLCILSYAGTLFKYSYIVKGISADSSIVFSYFADNKCKTFTSDRSVTLLEFQSTIYEFNYVYNAVNLTVAFSNSLKPPLPTNVSYATNLTFNALSGCIGSSNAQTTHFVSYMENVCIPVVSPKLDNEKQYLIFTMPFVRQYLHSECRRYLITESIAEMRCLFPLEKGRLSFETRHLKEHTTIDSANAPIFDDYLWQPYDDDAGSGGGTNPLYISRNPMQIYVRWKQIFNAELTAPPTLSPLDLPGASLSPSISPTILPTTAPTINLIYYHLRVTQQLLNVKASTLVADEMSRAVFSKAVSVLVGLPYSAVTITNITDSYPPIVYSNSSVVSSGLSVFSYSHIFDQVSSDSSNQSDILSLISDAETTNRKNAVSDSLYSYLQFMWPYTDKEFWLSSISCFSVPQINPVNMSCYVTYIIEYTPAQLNHTDPNKAYLQIKNQLTKRATSGIQTLSIVYFATNKNSTSLLNVDAATAPIISSFSITPSDIPNYPDGHSATDNVKAVTVLSVTIVGGITILLTLVWFILYITGSVRVFASGVNNNNNVEPNELGDVEIALVVGDESSAAAVHNDHSNVATIPHYSNNNHSRRLNDNDWSVHSL